MNTPLLLLPGLLCDDDLWSAEAAALAGDCDIVIADMTRDDTISGMASRAVARMPESFAVCGLSMGGYTAMEIMRQVPERVTRLALFDTSPYADPPERIDIRKALIERVRDGDFEGVTGEHFKTFVHPSRHTDDALIGRIRASADNVGPDAYIRQQTAIMGRPDSTDALSKVTCPTLVLCGAEDVMTPPSIHDEMAGMIPGATLVKVPGSGHLPTMEKPDEVIRAMRDWLELA